MSAVHSHCMSRLLLVVAAGLCLGLTDLGAQTPRRYEQYERLSLWNAGSNVAALRLDSLSYAEAALGAGYEAGAFRGSDDAAALWSAGAQARAVRSLAGFSLRGSFSFRNTEAYDMCGSMFMNPGFFPVDVMEFTPGRKTFQRYGLSGGIAVPLGDVVVVGAEMDFGSANAAKRKDLRYTGYKLDFSFAPSLLLRFDSWNMGLCLLYSRNSESIDAEQIGSAQNAPYAFFNEGLYYGNYQVWTGSGTHLEESGVSGLPVLQNSYGFALQAGTASLYADASLSWMRGRVGERQTIWYRYQGPSASASLALRHGRHTFRTGIDWSRLDNRETVLDKVVEGGVTTTVEYASNRVYSRSMLGIGLDYEFASSRFELRPSLSLFERRSLALPAYPEVAAQSLMGLDFGLDAWLAFGAFTMSPALGFYAGRLTDLSVAEGRMDDLYALQCEYESVPRLSLGSEFRLDFAERFYAALDAGCVKAFGVQLLDGSLRWSVGLKFGINFKY